MWIKALIKKELLIQAAGWVVYVFFWVSQYSVGPFSFAEVLKFTLFQMLFYVSGVYISNNLLVEKYLYKKEYVKFTLGYVILIVTIAVVLHHLNTTIFYTYSKYLYNYNTKYEGITANIFLTAFAISLPAAFKLNFDRIRSENEATKLLKDKIQEELKFLKSQINPHFLFNSLNTVYNLIDTNSEQAKNTLVKFSEILRYTLYDVSQDKISLAKEFEYIQAYSAIEKIRKGNSLDVIINDNTTGFFEVPPLMLLTFIENAFKHVSTFQQGNFVEISLDVTSTSLFMKVTNSKDSFGKGKLPKDNVGGIGLENIKRRLELLYPDRYILTVNETDVQYNVELKLYSYE